MPNIAALTSKQQKEASYLYQSGLSAQQVANHFSVSLNATFYALRKQKVPRRTKTESNRLRFESQELSYRIKENLTPLEERLRLSAVMLYWAEGYKVGRNTVDFANSDPEMVLIFRKFLTEICGVDQKRIRCPLYCYEGQDIVNIRTYWSTLLSIPESQFTKPYIKKSAPGPRGPRMLHGLVHIRYCDTKLLRQILKWIDEYRVECVGTQAVNEGTL